MIIGNARPEIFRRTAEVKSTRCQILRSWKFGIERCHRERPQMGAIALVGVRTEHSNLRHY